MLNQVTKNNDFCFPPVKEIQRKRAIEKREERYGESKEGQMPFRSVHCHMCPSQSYRSVNKYMVQNCPLIYLVRRQIMLSITGRGKMIDLNAQITKLFRPRFKKTQVLKTLTQNYLKINFENQGFTKPMFYFFL